MQPTSTLTLVTENRLHAVLADRQKATDRELPIIRIKDSLIDGELVFDNRSFRSAGVKIQEIIFSDCQFTKRILITSYQESGKFVFENCVFDNEVRFNENDNVTFVGEKIFNNNLTISSGHRNEVDITDYSVLGILTINSEHPTIFRIKNINVGQEIKKQKIIISAEIKRIYVENIYSFTMAICSVAKKRFFNNYTEIHCTIFLLNGPWQNSSVVIRESNIKKIMLIDVTNANNSIFIRDHCDIGSIRFTMSGVSEMKIKDCKVNSLCFRGMSKPEDIINIEKTEISAELRFDNVVNKGEIFLKELVIENGCNVAIVGSNLGNTDMISCDFSKANFEFENSKITELFLSDSYFPKVAKTNDVLNFAQAQLAFGQIATAYSNQGDTVKALEYQAREIEAHYSVLEWLSDEFFIKLNLWLNKFSSNFGRSWQKGIVFSFSLGAIFFFAIVMTSHDYIFSFPVKIDPRLISAFFKFMNPIRFLDLEALLNLATSQR